MSSSLYWRPVPSAPDGEPFGDHLKFAISPVLFDHDGSCSSNWVTVDAKFVPFLRGVVVAGWYNSTLRQEAEELIELIAQHEVVQLRIQR